jgi:hypothetical protein
MNIKTYSVEAVNFFPEVTGSVDLRHAAQMAVLFTALKDLYLFV